MAKRILFVLTSHDSIGDSGQKTGVWLEELAATYYVLEDGGFNITLASVSGGAVPVDPLSCSDDWLTEYGKRFLDDANAQQKLRQSLSLSAIDAKAFDAIYFVGGAGAAWDYFGNVEIERLLAAALEKGFPIAAICNGAFALGNKVNDKVIVFEKRVTCVSNLEEEAVGLDKWAPRLPETTLRELGASVEVAEPFTCNVIVDGQFVTGQNPQSALKLGEKLLEALQ